MLLVLAALGVLGALVNLLLHLLQLWPKLVPSQRVVNYMTLAAGDLVLVSCTSAPNAAALTMGVSIAGMALFAILTGKEVH